MTFSVRFTEEALDDLARLQDFPIERSGVSTTQAEAALAALRAGLALLVTSPFACRRAPADDPMLRELLVGYGESGYVALFEIEDAHTVTALAVRHQRESDYR